MFAQIDIPMMKYDDYMTKTTTFPFFTCTTSFSDHFKHMCCTIAKLFVLWKLQHGIANREFGLEFCMFWSYYNIMILFGTRSFKVSVLFCWEAMYTGVVPMLVAWRQGRALRRKISQSNQIYIYIYIYIICRYTHIWIYIYYMYIM